MLNTTAGDQRDRLEAGAGRVLVISTVAFTLLFAVWLMFGVLGIPIREEFNLTDVQLSWIIAVAVLNGSIWRLPAGMAADRWGGKGVFIAMLLFTAIPALLLGYFSSSYLLILFYAFLVGFAGNSFSTGIAWVSVWYPRRLQGTALGVFGAGNVGASATKFIGPALIAAVPAAGLLGGLIPGGWRFVPFLYAILLVIMAIITWMVAPSDKRPGADRSVRSMLQPLKRIRVWRFGLYYVVTFGAYVALAAWLPKYYVDVYGVPLAGAALLTALFIFPASLLRPVGGYFSDRIGARKVMYTTFAVMLICTGILMMPYGYVVVQHSDGTTSDILPWQVGVALFTVLVFLIGCAMGIGKAAVYKHIPEYFPHDVGAVGGLVGSLGALGGFFLPPLFAYATALTGAPQATFGVLFLVTLLAALWMHITVVRILHRASPELANRFEHLDADPTDQAEATDPSTKATQQATATTGGRP